MKARILFLVFFLAGGMVIAACDNQYHPDTKFITALSAKYPKASKVEWEAKRGYQVAEFRDGGMECEAWFDNNGQWVMTESDIKYTALPQAIRDSFEKGNYSNWKKEDIDRIEREGMETVFVIEVEKVEQDADLYYSGDGTLIKTMTETDGKGNYMPLAAGMREKLEQKYPGATIIDMEMGNGKLEIDIIDKGQLKEVIFEGEKWVSTSYEIKKAGVPAVVMDALSNSAYGKYRIDDIHYVETPEKSYYDFDLERGETDVHVAIDPEGKMME